MFVNDDAVLFVPIPFSVHRQRDACHRPNNKTLIKPNTITYKSESASLCCRRRVANIPGTPSSIDRCSRCRSSSSSVLEILTARGIWSRIMTLAAFLAGSLIRCWLMHEKASTETQLVRRRRDLRTISGGGHSPYISVKVVIDFISLFNKYE